MSITIIKADPGYEVAFYVEAHEEEEHSFHMLPVIAWEIEDLTHAEAEADIRIGAAYREYDITPLTIEGNPRGKWEDNWLLRSPEGKYIDSPYGSRWDWLKDQSAALAYCLENAKKNQHFAELRAARAAKEAADGAAAKATVAAAHVAPDGL